MFASLLKYQSASYFNCISTSKEREKLTFYIFVAKVWFTVYYMHKWKKKKNEWCTLLRKAFLCQMKRVFKTGNFLIIWQIVAKEGSRFEI